MVQLKCPAHFGQDLFMARGKRMTNDHLSECGEGEGAAYNFGGVKGGRVHDAHRNEGIRDDKESRLISASFP
jgi:hypothetical protein